MLNLSIAMRASTRVLLLILASVILIRGSVRAAKGPVVTYPGAGAVLQGVVVITGSSDMEGFESLEAAFGYSSGNDKAWFLIQRSLAPVTNGSLAVWDTTTITDGDYRLKVKVNLAGGESEEVVIPGLRVRNYTPVEFATPASEERPTLEPQSTATAFTPVLLSTPALLPTNSLIIQPERLTESALQGAAAALVGLAVVGLAAWARRR